MLKSSLHRAKDKDYFKYLVKTIVKTNREEPKLKFLFETFTLNSDKINAKQIADFIAIF